MSALGHRRLLCLFLLLVFGCLPRQLLAGTQEDLWTASERGNTAAVGLALKKGAKVNAKDVDGWTALMFASTMGHDDLVRELLRQGADPNLGTHDRKLPLYAAVMAGSTLSVAALLEAGALALATSPEGQPLEQLALSRGRRDIAALLAKKLPATSAPATTAAAPVTAAPAPQSAPAPTGVPAPIIKAYLAEEAQLRARRESVAAQSAATEAKAAQINAQRDNLAAQQQAAKARQYASCTSQVSECESSCRGRFTSSVVGTTASSRLGAVLGAVSAVTESEECERNCRRSANCESLR